MGDKGALNVKEQDNVQLIRILGKDIRGDKKVMHGLTNIRGISWAFSNALCNLLKIDKNKRIKDLTEADTKKIEKFIESPEGLPNFMKNRQKDFDTGKDLHLQGADLKLKQEFDIKRLKKIRSYKGVRHTAKLPVRGQRTKSHFRPNKKKTGGHARKQE